MLRAVGVGYRYPEGTLALKDVHLDVAPGEVVALVGPNGAGKSTLLRVLAGALLPGRGHVEGPPVRDAEGRLTRGYAPEGTVHFDELSGRANALFFARAAGLPTARARDAVARGLKVLGMGAEAERPVSSYSFGTRRKLTLLEVMVHDPSLLLLDEPSVGLDADSRQALVAYVCRRANAGGAVVLSSHDPVLVPEVASRLVFMDGGRVAGTGEAAALLAGAGAAVRFEFEVEGTTPPPGALAPGLHTVRAGPRLVVDSPGGAGALPDACAALQRAGATIRSVTVRDAGLAHAFRRVTGRDLEP